MSPAPSSPAEKKAIELRPEWLPENTTLVPSSLNLDNHAEEPVVPVEPAAKVRKAPKTVKGRRKQRKAPQTDRASITRQTRSNRSSSFSRSQEPPNASPHNARKFLQNGQAGAVSLLPSSHRKYMIFHTSSMTTTLSALTKLKRTSSISTSSSSRPTISTLSSAHSSKTYRKRIMILGLILRH